MRKRTRKLPKELQRLMLVRGPGAIKLVADPDRVLWVEGIPDDFPCKAAAIYCLHAAQDGRYGTIRICKGARHRHDFKVVDLVRHVKKKRPRANPWVGPSLKGIGMRPDSFFDTKRQLWVMGPMPRPEVSLAQPNEE